MEKAAPIASDVPRMIVGLGNPGPEYALTRHNVGFLVVDWLAKQWNVALRSESRWKGELGRSETGLLLLKPLTFMNLSGESVQSLAQFYKIPARQVAVIYDDLALPLGRLRIRPNGSSGGHNGMQSIIDHLGNQDIPRLRLGIGGPDGDMVRHVLSRFAPDEWPVLQATIARAGEAMLHWMKQGLPAAMNLFNSNKPQQEEKTQS